MKALVKWLTRRMSLEYHFFYLSAQQPLVWILLAGLTIS
jgi:hypothetical protein